MTWLSTWPRNGVPEYREHTTEAAAEAHARDVVLRGDATVAVVFKLGELGEAS